MNENEINGHKYKKCICWKWVAGCGEGCFDYCSEEQRKACSEQQDRDRIDKVGKEEKLS